MKTSILALIGMAACAMATPIVDLEIPEFDLSERTLATTSPFDFDYVVNVRAVPNEVVDSENNPTGGLRGSSAIYRLGFQASRNLVCYNITHLNFRGQYESPARTATHLHEGARGKAGPPRIAFPNPQGGARRKNQVGCMRGPFRTGVPDATTGKDTGAGFHVRQIIDRPRAFFVDAHSSMATPGAFRGQLPAGV